MHAIKGKNKSEKIFTVILTVLLLAFIGLVFYVNLSCNPEYYDGDILADINYAKAAWEAKSLFPSNWVFGNQTYVVATPVLASVIYGIMHNAILAMGIASCMMTVLVVLTYDWMTKALFSYNERMAGFLFLIGFLLLKAHIAMSHEGIQAFFTMASYYACYLINAFVVYGCYIRIRQRTFCKKHIPMLVIGAALSFATGMQSLRQTAVMALPLVACEIIFIIIFSIKNKKFAVSSSTAFSALIFLSNIAGVVAMKFIKINQESIIDSMSPVSDIKSLVENLINNIEYIMQTFGLYSLDINARLKAAIPFMLVIIVSFIICTRDFFKNGCHDKGELSVMILTLLGCASIFVASVFTKITSRSLYYFMIYPLLAVCVSYILVKLGKIGHGRGKSIAISAISIFAAFIIGFRTVGTVDEIKTGKDENTTAHQIANYMLDNGYDTIYSVFGLSGRVQGAENVVAASGYRINIVHFTDVRWKISGLSPVHYLHIKDEYKIRDNTKSLYLFSGSDLPRVKEIAEKFGVDITVKAQFGDIYLYSMSENLCALVESSYEQ